MRVLFKKTLNQPLELIEVDNTIEALQGLIGGLI